MIARVHYFAFGANTCRAVLEGRRGIVPLASAPAVLEGYALRFVLPGIPFVEPAFASIEPSPRARVHGVLHTLQRADLERLDRIEGGYDRIPVVVRTYPGERVEAEAYRARVTVADRPPSRRYRDLILEGAREHGLDPAWVEELRAAPCTHVPGITPALAFVARALDRVLARRSR